MCKFQISAFSAAFSRLNASFLSSLDLRFETEVSFLSRFCFSFVALEQEKSVKMQKQVVRKSNGVRVKIVLV
jgi:hypothetical protein